MMFSIPSSGMWINAVDDRRQVRACGKASLVAVAADTLFQREAGAMVQTGTNVRRVLFC